MDPRITPLQIEKKEFPRSFRGYDPKAVDAFRREIVGEMERLLGVVRQLETSDKELRSEVERYRAIESTMKDALLLAQRTADETKAAAHRQAEAALAETRNRCAEMEAEANGRSAKLRGDLDRLKQDRDAMVVYLRSMIEGFAARLDDLVPHTTATVLMEARRDGGVPDSGHPESES